MESDRGSWIEEPWIEATTPLMMCPANVKGRTTLIILGVQEKDTTIYLSRRILQLQVNKNNLTYISKIVAV